MKPNCQSCGALKVHAVKDKNSKKGFRLICIYCHRNRNKKWRLLNSDRKKSQQKRYREDNKEKVATLSKEWAKKNPERDKLNRKEWRRQNSDLINSHTRKRQAAKLKRTPLWLSELHLQQIEIFYDAAARLTKEFGIKMHVDHIVPLQGKNVSGLHVPWNLQVLPASENFRKCNKHEN